MFFLKLSGQPLDSPSRAEPCPKRARVYWMLDVGCWMFDVRCPQAPAPIYDKILLVPPPPLGLIPPPMNSLRHFVGKFSVAAALVLAGNLIAADTLPKLDLKPAYPNLKFTRPLAMVESPDGTHRLFVIEQEGRIWILPPDRNGSEPKLFLDITGRRPFVDNEEGLLSLAFHPQFKSNGKFYLWYSHPSAPKHTILAEWQVSKTDSNKADPASERILLEVQKP